MFADDAFTKENLDIYLKDLAKEFRKRNGKSMRAEIILTGGAAILARYGFRDVTYDIDAILRASSAMKEAITVVGDRHNLPNGWINSDFIKTTSYSPQLVKYSSPYRTFSNIVDVRVVEAEYLIAMKIMSGRIYKKDLSDVVGILYEHRKENSPIEFNKIDNAVKTLYGSWDGISDFAIETLHRALEIENDEDMLKFFDELRSEEKLNKKAALNAQKYDEEMNVDNIDEVIKKARSRLHEQKNVAQGIISSEKDISD